MEDITPAEQARAIRWIQEKLVFFALGLALICMLVSTVSVTVSVMLISESRDAMENMEDEMEVYQIYINNLDAQLRSMGVEPPELPNE